MHGTKNKFQPKTGPNLPTKRSTQPANNEGRQNDRWFQIDVQSSVRARQNRQWHEPARWMVSRIFESTHGGNCSSCSGGGHFAHGFRLPNSCRCEAIAFECYKLTSHNGCEFRCSKEERYNVSLDCGPFTLVAVQRKKHKHWLDFLQQTGLPYQYLSYDDLMSSRRDIFVHMVLHVAISGCQGYRVIPKTARPASSDSQSHL